MRSFSLEPQNFFKIPCLSASTMSWSFTHCWVIASGSWMSMEVKLSCTVYPASMNSTQQHCSKEGYRRGYAGVCMVPFTLRIPQDASQKWRRSNRNEKYKHSIQCKYIINDTRVYTYRLLQSDISGVPYSSGCYQRVWLPQTSRGCRWLWFENYFCHSIPFFWIENQALIWFGRLPLGYSLGIQWNYVANRFPLYQEDGLQTPQQIVLFSSLVVLPDRNHFVDLSLFHKRILPHFEAGRSNRWLLRVLWEGLHNPLLHEHGEKT